jgi:hypothetical protein
VSTLPECFALPTCVAELLIDAAKRDKLLAAPPASAHEPAAKVSKPEAKS